MQVRAFTRIDQPGGVWPGASASAAAFAAPGAVPPAPDQLRLSPQRAAIAKLQKQVADDLELQNPKNPARLLIQPHYETIFKAHPHPKGTVVFMHGYTAGPWQYNALADKMFKAGYNVYAPRLPGHGYMTRDGKPTAELCIKSSDSQGYDSYIDAVMADVKALGGPIHVVGLSGGGNVALRMAEKYPQDVKDVVALAPFLGPNGIKGAALKAAFWLDKLSFGLLGKVLEFIPQGKNKPMDPNRLTPHTVGNLSDGLAMQRVGHDLKRIPVPVQYITTAGDNMSGTTPVGELFERSGGKAKNGWLHFPPAAKVPHAMVSPLQNKDAAAVAQIDAAVLNLIDKGQFANNLPA